MDSKSKRRSSTKSLDSATERGRKTLLFKFCHQSMYFRLKELQFLLTELSLMSGHCSPCSILHLSTTGFLLFVQNTKHITTSSLYHFQKLLVMKQLGK
jgi:hypothetical protein